MPMSIVTSSSPIATTGGPLAAVDTDLLFAPWFEDDSAGAVAGLDAATGGELARALSTKEFSARPFDLWMAPIVNADWRPRRVALVGGGRAANFTTEVARKLATAAGLAARQRRVPRAGFLLRTDLTASSNVERLCAGDCRRADVWPNSTSVATRRTNRRSAPHPRGRWS